MKLVKYSEINEKYKITGAIHQRHELNDRLLQNGGHVGFGIRPSERRKGYAVIMLSLLFNNLWEQGFHKVLITCDYENTASSRTIEKNGGELLDTSVFEGTLTRRYWIYAPCKNHNNDK